MDMDNYTDSMSIMDARRARSSGIDCWSPRDIHNWLHSTSGGIVGQDAACRAAAHCRGLWQARSSDWHD